MNARMWMGMRKKGGGVSTGPIYMIIHDPSHVPMLLSWFKYFQVCFYTCFRTIVHHFNKTF